MKTYRCWRWFHFVMNLDYSLSNILFHMEYIINLLKIEFLNIQKSVDKEKTNKKITKISCCKYELYHESLEQTYTNLSFSAFSKRLNTSGNGQVMTPESDILCLVKTPVYHRLITFRNLHYWIHLWPIQATSTDKII